MGRRGPRANVSIPWCPNYSFSVIIISKVSSTACIKMYEETLELCGAFNQTYNFTWVLHIVHIPLYDPLHFCPPFCGLCDKIKHSSNINYWNKHWTAAKGLCFCWPEWLSFNMLSGVKLRNILTEINWMFLSQFGWVVFAGSKELCSCAF